MNLKRIVHLLIFNVLFGHLIFANKKEADRSQQQDELERILRYHMPEITHQGRVSFQDRTFEDWLKRTGEMPPDFHSMPSNPFLPNSLLIEEDGKQIPVKSPAQWDKKRELIKKQLQYYITGSIPPKPDNLTIQVLKQEVYEQVTFKEILLTFGPGNKATLRIDVYIPEGKGPYPVFLTQWNHREWGFLALRRGYMVCVFAGADLKDDTEAYSEIWNNDYDFSALMRRAFGASRAVDYLETLDVVDKDKIAILGHSRNGKVALWAAAFDERIDACVTVSGGTGAELPWRYNAHKYDVEDIAYITAARPGWFHPRLKFFIGREHKLPVDQNSLMALIAPRGLMITSAFNEEAGNLFGIETAYHEVKNVYNFLGVENNVAISLRSGDHGVQAKDIEEYIDFFDYVFGVKNIKPQNKLYFHYSFDKWKVLSEEQINPLDFAVHSKHEDVLTVSNKKITTVATWEQQKKIINGNIHWLVGEEPNGFKNPGPMTMVKSGEGEVLFNSIIKRPVAKDSMKIMHFTPARKSVGFGDFLYGSLYYPANQVRKKTETSKLPVIIFLHENDYSKGYGAMALEHEIQSLFEQLTSMGYGVFSYDMAGFGNRLLETEYFYERYPKWSLMGKMITDVKSAVTALSNLNFVDSSRIYVAGYALGGNVSILATALDERIAGAVSVAGFTPMRTNTLDRGTEGIMQFSHLYGNIPKLGFFIGYENRIPVDYPEIIACIAPRPLLLISPKYDRDAHPNDIENCVAEVNKVYKLYDKTKNLNYFSPDDYNRFSYAIRAQMFNWFSELKTNVN